MTKKTRLIILLVCVACFLFIAPVLVLYSMGDRFDFAKMRITSTGGIYVRTYPTADKIIIDSKITEKPGIFSNSIFVQSLLPDNHTVLVQKNGYYDYFKTIPVLEKEVTKLENVLLIDKDLKFQVVTNKTQSPFNQLEKFLIKNSNLYYSTAPENANVSATQKLTPILKSLVAFSIVNNNIIWLGADGFIYQSSMTGLATQTQKNATKITLTPLKINTNNSYKIISNGQNTFVIAGTGLLSLNTKTNNLDNFYTPVNDAKISPDGKNIVYYNDNYIYLSPILTAPLVKNTLYKSSEKISNFVWLNNGYIIFSAGNKIIISEIDYRGNINIVTLPTTITISPIQKIVVKNPQISFDQQIGKLYILTGNTLLSSEKITQ